MEYFLLSREKVMVKPGAAICFQFNFVLLFDMCSALHVFYILLGLNINTLHDLLSHHNSTMARRVTKVTP